MAAIEIPPDYFRVDEGKFSALVQPFKDALDGIHRDAVDALNALGGSASADTELTLATLDGDADIIANAIADEHTTLTLTPTSDVLGHYGAADGLTSTADQNRPPDSTPPVDIPDPGTPPDPEQQPGSAPPPAQVRAVRSIEQPPIVSVPSAPAPPVIALPPGAGATSAAPPDAGSQAAAERAQSADVPGAGPAAADAPAGNVATNSDALPVTRGELIELLSNLDFTINVQV